MQLWPPAVTEASLVANPDFAGAESVAVGAAAGRVGDPLPSAIPNEIADRGH